MGCDIHAFTEVKIDGEWHQYSALQISRSYELFSRMAGVRGYGKDDAIAQPRGLPTDVSKLVGLHSKRWGGDGHSHSWLSSLEAAQVQEWHGKECNTPFDPLFGYIFGNHINDHAKGRHLMADLRELGFEDARVVFWFDN